MKWLVTAALLLLAFPAHAQPNIGLLPFALDSAAWEPDGAGVELNVFPVGTGCHANYGLLDIGKPNNGIHDVVRQILEGVSAEDLSYHDGNLMEGEVDLPGVPGMNAAIAGALMEIIGEPRLVAVFTEVTDTGGANCLYTVVQWVPVRVVDVRLTANPKFVIIQPVP
jgi:hypothetical protein